MADNVVSFLLQVNDRVSPALASLRGEFRQTESSFSGIANGLATGFGAGFAIAGIQALTSAVDGLRGSFWNAAQAQTQLIASSSDVGSNLGVSIKESKEVIEGLQGAIANIAGALPGVTKDYNEAFLGFSGSLSKVFAGDTEGFKKAAEEMTKRAGVLAAIRNVPGIAAGQTLDRLLGGTTGFGEARQLDLLQKNPMLQTALQDNAKAKGLDISKMQQWSMKERYEVISAALKMATPDSLINEFKGTAESIVQGWQTNLFDPLIGLFGVSRRIVSKGNRSALDALTGFFQQIDILAKPLGGLNFDPMVELIDFLDWLAIGTAKLTSLSQQGVDLFSFESLIGFFRGLDMWVVNAFNDSLVWLKKVLDNTDWVQVGRNLFNFVIEGIANLGKVLISINWGDVANVLISGVSASIQVLYGALEQGIVSIVDLIKGWFDKVTRFIPGLGDGKAGNVSYMPSPATSPIPNIQNTSLNTATQRTSNVYLTANGIDDPYKLVSTIKQALSDDFDTYRQRYVLG